MINISNGVFVHDKCDNNFFEFKHFLEMLLLFVKLLYVLNNL